jgi:hypothetical protein
MTGLKSGSLLDRRLPGESGMAGDNFARRTVGVTRIRIAGEDGPPVADVGPAQVVHGDYRLDNMVLSPAGRMRRWWTGSCAPWATRWPPWSRPPPGPPSWPVDHHLEGVNFDADFGGARPRSDGDDEDGDNPDPCVTWVDLLERVGDLHNLSTRERQQGPDPVDQPWSAPSLFVPSVGEVRFEATRARICGEQSQSAYEPGPRTLAEAPRRERPDLAGTGRSGRPHDLGGPE